ncbi:MAG: ABC transporter substrate-binding protein [Ardenticatenales bacterium]
MSMLQRRFLAVASLAAAVGACGPMPLSAPTPTPVSGITVLDPEGRAVTVPPPVLTAVAAAPTDDPSDAGTFAERSEFPIAGNAKPKGYEGYSWQHFLDDAQNSVVRVALPDADERLTAWFDEWAIDVAAGRYGMSVERVPAAAAAAVVSDLAEERASNTGEGSIDLVWVAGRDLLQYRVMDGLYGPWTTYIPSLRYLDPADDSLSKGFGVAVEGAALPWGRTALVLRHDPAAVTAPPKTWDALWAWIAAHPGRFTYPAPPDPTGSAFVRAACTALAPDAAAFTRPVGDAAEAALAPCWAKLLDIAPSLWQGGRRHPASAAELDVLYEDADVDFSMRYAAGGATTSPGGDQGRASRTYVLDDGALTSTHFLAIPFNAPNKIGAMVLANFLLSPEAQFAKLLPENWGDLSVLSVPLIPEAWHDGFAEFAPPSGLDLTALDAHRRPEPSDGWAAAIDEGWARRVAGR